MIQLGVGKIGEGWKSWKSWKNRQGRFFGRWQNSDIVIYYIEKTTISENRHL